jgi:plasmid stabilization system protein ParE
VAKIVVTPRARADVESAITTLGLPADTWGRIGRSLRLLEDFPLAGRALEGRWADTRFVLGPWPWMILVYVFDAAEDRIYIVAMHDSRSSAAATHT